MSAFLKYLGAFVSGYLAAILPLMANGELPNSRQLISAIVPAVLATGLLHINRPGSNDASVSTEAGSVWPQRGEKE